MLLLQEDLFEAVIGLAPNLFYGTGIPASILVLNRDKPGERKGRCCSSTRQRSRGGEQPEPAAGPGHRAYLQGVPCVRRRGEVRAGGARHRDRADRLEPQQQPLRGCLRRGGAVDVGEAVRKLRELEGDRAAAETRMNRYLVELGMTPEGCCQNAERYRKDWQLNDGDVALTWPNPAAWDSCPLFASFLWKRWSANRPGRNGFAMGYIPVQH